MSQINVNRIKDSNEGAPDFPSGVNVSGITSTVTLGVTNLNPTNVNVSGVVTATTLDGNLLATGTPTLGLGVTINTSGLNISGVATAGIVSATTLYGNGANITGIALTIAPLNYNPAVLGSALIKTVGIGLTFNQAVKSGSGNVTLRIAGAAGTVVENFGVGNSVTYGHSDYGTTVTIDPTNNLNSGETYHISYPSGAFTNLGGDISYVGTAYTFGVVPYFGDLWVWGDNVNGQLGQNNTTSQSSPIQLPGNNWKAVSGGWYTQLGVKDDGTLWAWGENGAGELGQNNTTKYSSPVQIPGTTWSTSIDNIAETTGGGSLSSSAVTKTDGTLWVWGENAEGELGQNTAVKYSSPVQIPGTTWKNVSAGGYWFLATKTNGTLWAWGGNTFGVLGQSQEGGAGRKSSPTQIPGTTWDMAYANNEHTAMAIKTDNTLWAWGSNERGTLGQNQGGLDYSSPVQIPGTTWAKGGYGSARAGSGAIKTDGTLWRWGRNYFGQLGNNQNDFTAQSSPIQVPGTWSSVSLTYQGMIALRTNGTMWYCGQGSYANGTVVKYSSPVQIPGTKWKLVNSAFAGGLAIKDP